MNPFPAEHSVLMLNNCWIHHNALIDLVISAGKLNCLWGSPLNLAHTSMPRLPHSLSPSLLPQSESYWRVFQCLWVHNLTMTCIYADLVVVKAYLHCHGHYLQQLNTRGMQLYHSRDVQGLVSPCQLHSLTPNSVFCIIDTLFGPRWCKVLQRQWNLYYSCEMSVNQMNEWSRDTDVCKQQEQRAKIKTC